MAAVSRAVSVPRQYLSRVCVKGAGTWPVSRSCSHSYFRVSTFFFNLSASFRVQFHHAHVKKCNPVQAHHNIADEVFFGGLGGGASLSTLKAAKITVVGVGQVGMACAFSILSQVSHYVYVCPHRISASCKRNCAVRY